MHIEVVLFWHYSLIAIGVLAPSTILVNIPDLKKNGFELLLLLKEGGGVLFSVKT